ncbi:MAG TPA: acetate--CoA ligase family protein [Actinomycetes bacterium]
MGSSLAPLWDARSIAVIGATERTGALGRLPVAYLQRYGYRGRILPINPSAESVLGLPAYPSLRLAPGPVDLALVMVAAERVPDAIDDCAAAGVPVAVVMSSGFAEAGPEGKALQDEVVRRARAGGVRVVGPNCIGSVGFGTGQVASFSPMFGAEDVPVRDGSIGFVTQSGALGYGAVSLALARGLGLGWVVNTGNESDVGAVEVLTELLARPDCTGVIGYVESLADGAALRRLAALGKPVALLKAGSTDAGARAAASHTGALAASDRVVDGVLRQLGIARARDVEDLLDLGDAFEQPRRPAGPRVAVVTTSGGSGILAADAIAEAGLELAALSAETTAVLAEVVPAFGAVANPVDVTATVMSDPALFDRCLDVVADDHAVDAVVACFCVLTGDDVDRIVDSLARAAGRTGKPILVARTGADFLAPKAGAALRAAGIPAYPTPARAVRALAALRRTSQSAGPARPEPPAGPDRAAEVPVPGASEVEVKALLAGAGLPVARGRLASGAEDAVTAVRELGGRAVLKAVVPGLLHKTEAGGVAVGVTPEDAAAVFDRLAALGGSVLVEEQVDGGAEVLVGVAATPLGQVVTLASGGVLTEVVDDAVFRLLPIGAQDARDMLGELRGAAVLRGVRGRPPLDTEALVRLLADLSDLVAGWPDGYELDLNPVAVLPVGVRVLDAAYVAPAAGGGR